MKNNKIKSEVGQKQGGAILSLEVVSYIAIVVIIIGVGYSIFSSNKDTGKNFIAKQDVSITMITAIENCHAVTGNLASCDKTALQNAGMSAKTAFGDDFTVSALANQITLVYPLDNSNKADSLGSAMAAYISSNFDRSASPTYNSSTDDLTIVYTR